MSNTHALDRNVRLLAAKIGDDMRLLDAAIAAAAGSISTINAQRQTFNETLLPSLTAIVPGSTFGTIWKGHPSAQTVVGIYGNDLNDAFNIVTDNDFDGVLDKLVFRVNGRGDITVSDGARITRRVDTIADLKALPMGAWQTGEAVIVSGFDDARDGCGGIFVYSSLSPPAVNQRLDGVLMAATGLGHWVRLDYNGVVHTRWVGIKPDPTPNTTYDRAGFGANNRTRWNAMSAFCGRVLMTFLPNSPTAAAFTAATIFIDGGVHDFVGGNLTVPEDVAVTGSGRHVSVLRANITSGVFLTVGSVGSPFDNSALYSAFADINDFSVLSHTLVEGGTGLQVNNAVRGSNLSRLFIMGFGINLHVDAFGINLDNLWLQSGYTNNLKVGPRCNSIDIQGCRFDDQRLASGGDNVLIEEIGYSRGVRIHRCDIQRSHGRALRFIGIADAHISACFFEGNNRSDTGAPDIWIEGSGVRNFVIDACYFTGTGRFNSTGSRAINIRDNVTANARFQISNCQQASGAQGTFANFIDSDADVALQIAAWNNIHDAPNSIGPNNVKLGLAAGTW